MFQLQWQIGASPTSQIWSSATCYSALICTWINKRTSVFTPSKISSHRTAETFLQLQLFAREEMAENEFSNKEDIISRLELKVNDFPNFKYGNVTIWGISQLRQCAKLTVFHRTERWFFKFECFKQNEQKKTIVKSTTVNTYQTLEKGAIFSASFKHSDILIHNRRPVSIPFSSC